MILTYVTLKSSTPYDQTVTDFNRNANEMKRIDNVTRGQMLSVQ